MKVLFVSAVSGMSGAEIVLRRFLRSNQDIDAVILLPRGPLQVQLEKDGHRIYLSRGLDKLYRDRNPFWPLVFVWRWLLSSIEIIRVCRRERPDIIHASHFAAALYVVCPAKLLGIPIIWHIHDIIVPGTLAARVCPFLSKLVARVIAVSNAVRESLARNGIAASSIRIVHNGIDFRGEFNPEKYKRGTLRSKYDLGSGVLLVGLVGLLVEWKGQHIYLEAIRRVRYQLRRQAAFFIIGDSWGNPDSYKQSLLEKARADGLNDVVYFTGRLQNIPEILADLDIAVHASVLPDPFPNVILEAMSMQKIVIASDCGGASEMLEDDETGFLHPPGDVDALTDLLRRSINGFEGLERLGHEARRTVEERFSEAMQRSAIHQIYRELTVHMVFDRAIPKYGRLG